MHNEPFFRWRTLLLNYYKALFLSEEEVMVLLMIDLAIKRGNRFVTPDILILKMNTSMNDLERVYVSLLSRGYVANVKDGDTLITSLDGIYTALVSLYMLEMKNGKEKIAKTIELIEKEFQRPLTSFEFDVLTSWQEKGYPHEIIKWALKETKSKNINQVDNLLNDYRRELEISNEGNTTLSDMWKFSIDETAKIAKEKWNESEED